MLKTSSALTRAANAAIEQNYSNNQIDEDIKIEIDHLLFALGLTISDMHEVDKIVEKRRKETKT